MHLTASSESAPSTGGGGVLGSRFTSVPRTRFDSGEPRGRFPRASPCLPPCIVTVPQRWLVAMTVNDGASCGAAPNWSGLASCSGWAGPAGLKIIAATSAACATIASRFRVDLIRAKLMRNQGVHVNVFFENRTLNLG